MKRQFFSGNTLEQAILLAARHFGIEPERVAYSLRDKKHGFLKIRRRVVIEVDSEAPELPAGQAEPLPPEPAAPISPPPFEREERPRPEREERPRPEREERPRPKREERPRPEREERQPEKTDRGRRSGAPRRARSRAEVSRPDREERPAPGDSRSGEARLSEVEAVERGVREILRFLDVRADVAVEREAGLFAVEITDPDRDSLVDREGRVLQAMEYLVPRIVRRWRGHGVPVRVDCEGFRAGREEELRELASEVAEEVLRAGRPRALEPMNPADRRIVHLALADDPDVYTESDGEGYFKRVRILPADLDDDDGDYDNGDRDSADGPEEDAEYADAEYEDDEDDEDGYDAEYEDDDDEYEDDEDDYEYAGDAREPN